MEPGVHLFIGMVNTGKTSVVFQILRKLGVEHATVVCGHEDRIARYQSNFPMFNISDEFDILADVSNGSVVIIDDRLYDTEWYRYPHVKQLLETAKARGIRFYITMVYAIGTPRRIRQYFDTVHIFRERKSECMQRIYRLYGNLFDSYEEYIEIMHMAFENDYTYEYIYLQCTYIPRTHIIKNIKDGY